MRQVRKAAVIVGLCTLGWLPAAAQTVDLQKALSAAVANVRVGTLDVRDLNFDLPGSGRLTIGRIGFTRFVHDRDRVRAERIDIEKLTITVGAQTTEVPLIVLSGADLPGPLFRAVTAGERANDIAGLLGAATVERITIDRIVQRDALTKLEVVHNGFVLNSLKDGMVGSARLAGAEAIATGLPPPASTLQMRMGEIRYEQFDLIETVRMFTGGGSGPAKRVLQRAVVDGVEIVSGPATIRINRAEIVDLDGRAPAQPMPAGLQGSAAARPIDPEQQKRAAAFAGDLLRHVRIGRYSIEGISVSVPGQGRFALGSFTIAGFNSRGIDRIEFTGFDLAVPGAGAAARFDRFELAGISYGALLEAALNAGAAGQKPDFSPAQLAQMLPRLAAIRLARLDLDTPQGPVALGDLRFELDVAGDNTHANYTVRGLKVDLRKLEANEGRDQLIALGYGEIAADVQARVSLLRNERALVVESTGLSLDKVGRIEITARLDNVDIDKAFADPENAEQVLNAARLGPIQIRLADLGLAERFYANAARSAGISADAMRAGLAAEMRAQAIANFGPLLAGRSADAIATFLQSSGTITARIGPAAGKGPLTVGEAQSLAPPELMQRLTVTLEAAPR